MDEFQDALNRAKEAFGVLDCWRDLIGGEPKRLGGCRSPFREDRNPSFSVFRHRSGVLLCKDHSTDEIFGAWEFVKRARPEWDSGQITDYFFEKSGVPRPKKRELTPAEKRASRKDREREAAEARQRVYREREKAAEALREVDGSVRWSEGERSAWNEGVETLGEDPKRRAALAEARGWPVEWVDALAEAGHVGVPMDWTGRRNVAFVVERPVMDRSGSLTFEQAGYHQRWYDARSERKMWSYRPKGLEAYPFVLGWRVAGPEVCILTEGQWDACTLWGALGGWDDYPGPLDGRRVTVAGLRGASGIEPALAALGPWLRRHRPHVVLLADADKAGARWRTVLKPGKERFAHVSLAERVARLVEPSTVRLAYLRDKAGHGKDFNDWWKDRRACAHDVAAWLERMLTR